jgi:hypothetical protein
MFAFEIVAAELCIGWRSGTETLQTGENVRRRVAAQTESRREDAMGPDTRANKPH